MYIYRYMHKCIYMYKYIYIKKCSSVRELNISATGIKVSAQIPTGFKAGIKMRLEQSLKSAQLSFVILARMTILALFLFFFFLFLCLLLHPPPKSYLKLLGFKWARYKVKIISCEYRMMVYFVCFVFTNDAAKLLAVELISVGETQPLFCEIPTSMNNWDNIFRDGGFRTQQLKLQSRWTSDEILSKFRCLTARPFSMLKFSLGFFFFPYFSWHEIVS